MQQPYFMLRIALVSALAVALNACSSAQSGASTSPESGLHNSNDNASLENPVKPTPESLASGKKLYERLCADCHGVNGDGVSEIAAAMAADEVRPPNLIDNSWDHGSTDGEIFVAIRDGVGGPGAMKGLNGRPGIGPTEIWQMVNYVRSLKK
jgi:cytochrome c